MVKLSGMESDALIAAALAPPPGSAYAHTQTRRGSGRLEVPVVYYQPASQKMNLPGSGDGGDVKRAKASTILTKSSTVSKAPQWIAKQVRFGTRLAEPAHTTNTPQPSDPVPKKGGWVNIDRRDHRIRDGHRSVDGQTREISTDATSHKILRPGPAGLQAEADLRKRKVSPAVGNTEYTESQHNGNDAPGLARNGQAAFHAPETRSKQMRLDPPLNTVTVPSPGSVPARSPEDEDDQDYNPASQSDRSDEGESQPPAKKHRKSKCPNPTISCKPNSGKDRARNKCKTKKSRRINKTRPSGNRSTSAKNRIHAFPVASTLTEASEADKVMFRMKCEGKAWREITAEWGRMTGTKPGYSSLSVRYLKSKEKFARMGDVDLNRLLSFKCQVEKSWEAREKWDRVAALIRADGGTQHTGQTLRLRYQNLMRIKPKGRGWHAGAAGAGAGTGNKDDDDDDDEAQNGDDNSIVPRAESIDRLDSVDRELMGHHHDKNNNNNDDIHDDPDTSRLLLQPTTQQLIIRSTPSSNAQTTLTPTATTTASAGGKSTTTVTMTGSTHPRREEGGGGGGGRGPSTEFSANPVADAPDALHALDALDEELLGGPLTGGGVRESLKI